MRILTIFNIIIGALSIILVMAGSFLLGRSDTGYWVLYSGLFLATIFTISAIIDVMKSQSMNSGRRTLWLIMVICVPVLGGLLYYLIHVAKQGKNVISTPDYEDKF